MTRLPGDTGGAGGRGLRTPILGEGSLWSAGAGEPHVAFTSMVWRRWKKEFILENARDDGNSHGTGSLSF